MLNFYYGNFNQNLRNEITLSKNAISDLDKLGVVPNFAANIKKSSEYLWFWGAQKLINSLKLA